MHWRSSPTKSGVVMPKLMPKLIGFGPQCQENWVCNAYHFDNFMHFGATMLVFFKATA